MIKVAALWKTTSNYSCFEVHVLSVANLMYNQSIYYVNLNLLWIWPATSTPGVVYSAGLQQFSEVKMDCAF